MNQIELLVQRARNDIGLNEYEGTHMYIVDAYNGIKPLPVGYTVKRTDNWCAAAVTKWFAECNALYLVHGGECGCQRWIELFQEHGEWIEDGTVLPKVGDIIFYNWDDSTQPNTGWSDHVGLVDQVFDNTFTVVEGNYSNAVKKRTVKQGYGCIRGFARPKYDTAELPTSDEQASIQLIAAEVVMGLHGNGHAAREASIHAMYGNVDYQAVRTAVNEFYTGKTSSTYPAYSGDSSRIDDVFRDIGAPYGNWTVRKDVAEANGIADYVGSYIQNTALIILAKKGGLVRE